MRKSKPDPEHTSRELLFEEQAAAYAHGSIATLRGFLDALEHAQSGCDGEDCKAGADSDWPEAWHDEDQARQQIDQDPLEIQVRGDWHTPGDVEEYNRELQNGVWVAVDKPIEYYILLTTGGPAARIIGELNDGEPTSARFQYQDWFKPWTEVILSSEEYKTILEYAQYFYFGS